MYTGKDSIKLSNLKFSVKYLSAKFLHLRTSESENTEQSVVFFINKLNKVKFLDLLHLRSCNITDSRQ